MDIFSCEHPVRVYNKYIGEYVHVGCGKCNACKKKRASRWVARLERERMCRRFCFFVTLTYSDAHLPLLTFESASIISDVSRSVSIPFSELVFSTAADRQYFDSRMALGGIPYASVSDLQKFHKRLNKYFHDNVTQTYKNFRYFSVSEYGSTTLRPHFHSIYFTDSEQVASHFSEGIRASWQFGIIDCQYVQKSANSYVAQYLNELFDLPSFYQHRQIRPFFCCSKQPPIGGDLYNEEEFREIFESASPLRTVRSSSSETSFVDVPLLPCVENRLFPRCRAFREIPHSLRVAVYRQCIRGILTFTSFSEFRAQVSYAITLGSNKLSNSMLDINRYLSLVCDNFSERGLNALKRLYYISKRVVSNCLMFRCTIDYYVFKIEEYWNRKELYILKTWYIAQERNGNPEELVHCFPEFVYELEHPQIDGLVPYVLPLSECPSYRSFCAENAYLQEKHTKSHFKNAYFQSLEDRNNPLFQILKTFYYAKKCYEASETFGKS